MKEAATAFRRGLNSCDSRPMPLIFARRRKIPRPRHARKDAAAYPIHSITSSASAVSFRKFSGIAGSNDETADHCGQMFAE